MEQTDELFVSSLINAYIKDNDDINSDFSPEFIYNSNNKLDRKQVIKVLAENLKTCDEFMFSVAFISDSGISPLKIALKECQNKNVKGRILTSNYLDFTEPKALKELDEMPNVDVKLLWIDDKFTKDEPSGFHTKGYIFKFKDTYKIIIGSSNLTGSALTSNEEWNSLIVTKKDGKIAKDILNRFETLWSNDHSLSIKTIIDKYEEEYESFKEIRLSNSKEIKKEFKPNSMQLAFCTKLNESIDKGDKRGLLISATGTGKTYASAFGVKSIKDKIDLKKMLFITHRETILKQAIETYRNVLGQDIKADLFSNGHHDIKDKNYIFSTVNTMNLHLKEFTRDEFDLIIVDECHRIGKEGMYQNILKYFQPKFLLGMSATPDRTDGYDIYNFFDHNILYEIRLYNALESKMLVPFYYFGISDILINGKQLSDDATFDQLTCDDRIDNIINNRKYYGSSGSRIKTLMFVSKIEEGIELSKKLNNRGLKTIFLSGSSSNEDREKYIKLLEEDKTNNPYLDMILTVDIFNEGVDIPSVNQIILLRPTQSTIIFLQQLGRGLRKFEGKDYLTVIDFIGNYKNDFMITDSFSSKNNGEEYQSNGGGRDASKTTNIMLPGGSIIDFDPITMKTIVEISDKAIDSDSRRIKEQYIAIKNKLGRIPTLIEYDENGDLTGRVFLDLFKQTYYDFLSKEEIGLFDILSQEDRDEIKYLSNSFGNGLRIHEGLLLKTLIEGGNEEEFIKQLPVNQIYDEKTKKSVISVLDTSFLSNKGSLAYSTITIKDDRIQLSDKFKQHLLNKTFNKFINEIIDYSIYSNKKYFSNVTGINNFVLYERYSRKDVSRLINLTKNQESTIYGYRIFKDLNIVPIFVTYNKHLDKESQINYSDYFKNRNIFCWDSRHDRTTESQEIKDLLSVDKNNGQIMLFVQRESPDNKDGLNKRSFYYLGNTKIQKFWNSTNTTESRKKTNVVKFELRMDNPIPDYLFKYFVI